LELQEIIDKLRAENKAHLEVIAENKQVMQSNFEKSIA